MEVIILHLMHNSEAKFIQTIQRSKQQNFAINKQPSFPCSSKRVFVSSWATDYSLSLGLGLGLKNFCSPNGNDGCLRILLMFVLFV